MDSVLFTPSPARSARLRSRSMGTKFFFLLMLSVMMSLPGFFVSNLTVDRANTHGIDATSAGVSSSANSVGSQPTKVLGVPLAGSYRSVHRSLKYITLILGLVFLTYFIFEVTTGKQVHPAQYALVGVAQTIFYLLLLSFAEHLGFDLAFLIGGGGTVLLLALNIEWIFASRALGLRGLGVFSALYAFIYVLLRLENYALLVGSIVSFIAVAATMYATRRIDWYSDVKQPVSAREDFLR